MTRSILLSLCLVSAFIGSVSAQGVRYDTLYSIRQELPLPANDSGGRWLSSAVILSSASAYPTHVQIETFWYTYPDWHNIYLDTAVWEIADSGYYLADSIFMTQPWTRSSTPWKYIDSVGYPGPSYNAQLDFMLPAHGVLRIPIRMWAATQYGRSPGNITSTVMGTFANSDSMGKIRYFGANDSIHCVAMCGGTNGTWQESVPSTDSGGKWMPTAIDFLSVSPYPIRVWVTPRDVGGANGNWAIADSGYALASEMLVQRKPFDPYDTILDPKNWVDSSYEDAVLKYTIPPHERLRLPMRVRAIDQCNGCLTDTISYTMYFFSRYGSTDKYGSGGDFSLRAVANCEGPYVPFTGAPIDNRAQPAVIGRQPASMYRTGATPQYYGTTKAHYQLSGEYADRFKLPVLRNDSTVSPDDYFVLEFDGAPKSPVHDTLVATFTDCWGSITTSTPIAAYSAYADGYQVRQLPLNLTAPFLGSAQGSAAKIVNTSDFPITVRNLHIVSYDSMDFDVSAPSMIAAHDSGFVAVTLTDRDIYLDTLYPDRSGSITGIIAPYQQELNFQDSTFSTSVTGTIDVWTPSYFSSVPKLKRGTHPKGVIFTSSISSKAGPHTFLTVYGNDDSTTEYFGMPYYDDPHFTLADGNYTGFGTVTLPGYVTPDTGFPPPSIQLLTTFTGDGYHNYYTKMHWPRSNDTITLDVVAVGNNAPPYQSVREGVPSTFQLWPNPASHIVHIESGNERSEVWIIDVLGRTVRKQTLPSGSEVIDVSDVPQGMYELYLPSLQRSVKLYIVR